MAQNNGGDGKGTSKFRTTDQDRDDRLKARKNKQRNRAGRGQTGGTDLMTELHADRQAEREQRRAEAEEGRRLRILEENYNKTLGYVTRYGETLVPGNLSMRPRWGVEDLKSAPVLLRLYFFGVESDEFDAAEEIKMREGLMRNKVVDEVRKRFAGACHLDRRIKGTPGQEQEWFDAALTAAEEFHTRRRQQRRQERELAAAESVESPATTDTAQTDEPKPDEAVMPTTETEPVPTPV